MNANQSISLKAPQQAVSFEVHSNKGLPPKKIVATKVNDTLNLELVDEVTGEHYIIVLENYSTSEPLAIVASGPDGVMYTYEYNIENGLYDLTSTQVESLTADNMLALGGAFAAAAALIGVATAASSQHHRSNTSSSSAAAGGSDLVNDSGLSPVMTDQAGNIINNGSTISESTPTFNGNNMTPGSTVVISDGGVVMGEATVDPDGRWTFTPETPLADGKHSLTVAITDPDGNTGSDTVTLIVDTVAPELIDTADITLTNDIGDTLAVGGMISDTTPTFTAEGLEAGTTVTVSDDGVVMGSATVNEDGSWSFTPDKPLAEGEHRFTFEATDAAGNSSGESKAISYTVDSVAPKGVDISTVIITDEAGKIVSAADTLNDSKLTFSGSDLEAGTTVTIYDKGEVVGKTIVAADGSWTYTDKAGLYDGSHEITFTVTDAVGNSSDPSASLNFNLAAIVLTAVDNISSDATVGFDYPIDIKENLGVLLSDSGLIALNNTITSDPIVVADGTFISLDVVAKSSAFVNVANNSTLVLQKYDSSTGEWVNVRAEESGNLFGMFGLGASSSSIELTGLTAGTYQLVYTSSGLNLGVSFSLDATKTVYTLAEQGTPTNYTTATGNVITDTDSVYGSDGIPHSPYTSVTSINITNSDGSVSTATFDTTTTKATLVGQYGTLTISADGSYEYVPVTLMNSIGKVDTFTYTLTDSATGETSSAQLYVQIGSTNDGLMLSWDATNPSAEAVTDIASNNEANASVTVTYDSSSASNSDVKLTAGNTENYTSAFTLTGNDDLVTGSLTLSTEWGPFGNIFSKNTNITYTLQMLNSDGTWSTVNTYAAVVLAGNHNDETVLTVDMSTLVSEAGTYRVVISTNGATNVLKFDMNVDIVSTTDYVITANEIATGNVLTDEGTDGSVDKLSSIYTKMYVKAGDSADDKTVDNTYTHVTESGITIIGAYGTLVIYSNGAYTYTPSTTSLPTGSEDIFTYALQGANGEVVMATVTINLGVEVDGSNGGALVFDGTAANDVFAIYDTDFASVDGKEGSDTLSWHGNDELVLSSIADKVSNIESIALASDGGKDNLVLTAQSVADVTNEGNSLYIKGETGDTVTMEGTWINGGTVVVDSVVFTHYTGTAVDGSAVNIYVQSGLLLSATDYSDSTTGTKYDVTSTTEVVGTVNDDTFNVSNTNFSSIDGGEGFDTLVWNGTGTLTVSDIASKISNIEEIDLLNDTGVDNLLISAQNVADITDGNNTLFVKGSTTDTLTLSGSWQLVGSEVVNNVDYIHYASTTASGNSVELYVDSDIKSSSTETASETNASGVTGQVQLVSEHIDQTTTIKGASGSFTSESFTVNNITDLQTIHVNAYTTVLMNANNNVSVNWSLQVYNSQTYSWDTVTSGLQSFTREASSLDVTLPGQQAGTYRVVVENIQSGYSGALWATRYDELTVKVSADIVSTTDYKVSTSSSITSSVFTSDTTSDGSTLVKSIAAGIVTGTASYTLVAAAGTTIEGTYGTLTIHTDGSYTYTLNSDSVIKLSGSEDSFTYVLADGTTKNLIMTLGVSVDGSEGGALIFVGTIGDDSFSIHDTSFASVDGKSGHDTLVWSGKGDLQLSAIADKVHNIEVIDLKDNGAAAVLTLSADDIEKVTDDNNVLYVRGGSEDSLSLQGVWEVSGVEILNNIAYTLYTGNALDGKAVKLYVQDGLTFNEVAESITGSLPSDEAPDLSVVSVSQNGEVVDITGGEVSFKGAYGTLLIDGNGHYSYLVNEASEHSGNIDTFTYTLSDGSSESLSFNLGMNIDGSEGGAITFSGTSGGDVFQVYDTDFISINGADSNDTLAWHGTGTLKLSDISSKVDNIEKIDLLNDSQNDNLVISSESLLKVTDDNNTLYVRGADGDTVTLNGTWDDSGSLLVNGVTYNHYTSTTTDSSVVQLYVEDDVTIG
ncbi:BapA/Bap/LapF family large adhesin [Hafnia psychrotolerans]|uniref:BapA/Bap/LapF family large adhesin n=1 Tax=Hafnia psychrotolerans TaxID=1477018 RepID=UPI001E5793E7|nr:BapA/Bap/LapF family large adhesin [Hafnia psychrotolerans]